MASLRSRNRRSPSPSAARARRSRASISYREPSTDEELDDEVVSSDSESDEEDAEPASRVLRSSLRASKRLRVSPRPGSSRPSRPSTARRSPMKRKLASKSQRLVPQILPDPRGSGVVPPWSTLPYEIIRQILSYSAMPLNDLHAFVPMATIGWLLRMARLCRAFTEPALSVLYSSPPLFPMDRAHGLLQLLRMPPDAMAFNYRAKIEKIQLEVNRTAAYSLHGSGLLDVGDLVRHCPRLLDLELHHEWDMSPYRSLDHTVKWTYPEALFDALRDNVDHAPTWLRSWRWSSRLAGRERPLEKLREIHLQPSFQSLQKVAFVNYQIPSLKIDELDPKHEQCLADCLAALPHLRHLVLESSTLVNAKLLPLLPTRLHHLELINCWEVTSDDMAAFLVTHGHELRSLVLNHNQSLSLSFLPVLGSSCPQLELLHMNLTYYNIHFSYHDSEPDYDQLMRADEVPTWPSSLQVIELSQLRKWESTEAAVVFFESLLNSAPSLPDLRRLTVKAILNIGWRDRSSFRDHWVGTLERVFRRRSRPPRPDWYSVSRKQNTGTAAGSGDANGAPSAGHDTADLPSSPDSFGRRELPIRQDTDDQVKPPTSRRSRRLREAEEEKRQAQQSEDSDEAATALEKGKGKDISFIHGMCDEVEIRIDNLRPREEQFTEDQFLDAEPEDDDDWDGSVEGDWTYAW